VFGKPVTGVAQFVGEPRKINCVAQSLRGCRTRGNRRKIEDREPVF